jgi:hypothetical protein
VNAIQTFDTTQHPYKIWSSAPVTVDGKLTFVMEDETELLRMINNTQPSLDILFSTGTGASQQRPVPLHEGRLPHGKDQPGPGLRPGRRHLHRPGNDDRRHHAGTGFSPVKVTLKNTKATGTYL